MLISFAIAAHVYTRGRTPIVVGANAVRPYNAPIEIRRIHNAAPIFPHTPVGANCVRPRNNAEPNPSSPRQIHRHCGLDQQSRNRTRLYPRRDVDIAPYNTRGTTRGSFPTPSTNAVDRRGRTPHRPQTNTVDRRGRLIIAPTFEIFWLTFRSEVYILRMLSLWNLSVTDSGAGSRIDAKLRFKPRERALKRPILHRRTRRYTRAGKRGGRRWVKSFYAL